MPVLIGTLERMPRPSCEIVDIVKAVTPEIPGD